MKWITFAIVACLIITALAVCTLTVDSKKATEWPEGDVETVANNDPNILLIWGCDVDYPGIFIYTTETGKIERDIEIGFRSDGIVIWRAVSISPDD